jgi:16S rRNA (uracil1498-N3)-methyltransferase
MARRRFFVDAIQHGMAELAGEDGHHLARVLRAQAGQQFEISDNRSVYLAEVREVRKDRVIFQLLEPIPSGGLRLDAVVYTALIRFERFEWMVEKLTELGAAAIVPVAAARSEKGLAEAARKRVERWRRIAREASQQARRDRLPEVHGPVRLEEALRDASAHHYFLDEERGGTPLVAALPASWSAAERTCLLTGPEGGWTADERWCTAAAGWTAVSLGPHILRAETAAVAAFSVLACTWWSRGGG